LDSIESNLNLSNSIRSNFKTPNSIRFDSIGALFLIWDEGGEDVKELIPPPKRDGDVVEQAIVDLEEQYWSFCQSVRLSSLTELEMDSQGPSQGRIHESSNTPTGSTNRPTRYHPTGFKHGGPTPKGLSLHLTEKEWRQAYCAANKQREEHHKRLEHTRNSANKDRKNGKTGQIAIQLLKDMGKLDASQNGSGQATFDGPHRQFCLSRILD
jgi:hypothetical protein